MFRPVAIVMALASLPFGRVFAATPMPAPRQSQVLAVILAFRHAERALARVSTTWVRPALPVPAPAALAPPMRLPLGPLPPVTPFSLPSPPLASVPPPQTFGGGGGTVGPPTGGSFGSPPPLGGSFGGGRPTGGSFGNGQQ